MAVPPTLHGRGNFRIGDDICLVIPGWFPERLPPERGAAVPAFLDIAELRLRSDAWRPWISDSRLSHRALRLNVRTPRITHSLPAN